MPKPMESDTDRQDDGSHDNDPPEGRKRPHKPTSDSKYPRKRSSRACHVCRARKTKCDNAQPTCGFCAALNIPCSYDATERDHSTFDPASLEILRQLGQIITSQDDLLHTVRSIAGSQTQSAGPELSPAQTNVQHRNFANNVAWHGSRTVQIQHSSYRSTESFSQESDSTTTSPAASAGAAASKWFDLLVNDASREVIQDVDGPLGIESLLDQSDGQGGEHLTPLQLATRIIDSQPTAPDDLVSSTKLTSELPEESLWQSSDKIRLLGAEQVLFEHFLRHICSWLDLFDPAKTFSTRVPHLAIRNAGLLNAIMALSSYHQSLDENISADERANKNKALQYYYQTLHYVQKAMRYPTYQNSKELMATTLIVSTYEMLRGSRKDWEQHLQGVFWILRSRQIEVESPSLESTTWWAWLQQDIWVAFRERRRTYSTWIPKKQYSELTSHEMASRAVWIMAQVINFCALNTSEQAESTLDERLKWARTLRKMLYEWQTHLTIEFSPLPISSRRHDQVFQPLLIHPQCFGSAMQVHHVSQILVCAYEPSLGGVDCFLKRQSIIQESIDMICGIGMTLTEDASSMLSSQCLFIAGIFIQDPRQKSCVLDMLASCRSKCAWPTPSLGSELEQIWRDRDSPSSIM